MLFPFRYYFELEEYKQRKQQELQEEDEERGWSQPSTSMAHVALNQEVSKQPKPAHV